jgi:hypothetical protein
MPIVIINGRRVTIPGTQTQGSDIISQVNPRDGRRTVIYSGIEAETIEPYKTYRDSDLVDKKGNPVKVTTIPDRTKGSFWGDRSRYSQSIITEQVYDIAAHYFKSGVEFDEENAHWLKVPKYILPKMWHSIAQTSPLLIVFPTEYPEQPPIGFYLKADLRGAPDGHLFPSVYHEAAREPLDQGWKWYCVYINPGSWQPARVRKSGDWKYGDNLWTYFTLIKEALSTS